MTSAKVAQIIQSLLDANCSVQIEFISAGNWRVHAQKLPGQALATAQQVDNLGDAASVNAYATNAVFE